MTELDKINQIFFEKGFVVIKNIFSKKKIKKLLIELKKVKIKSVKIKNKNMHYTEDNKFNTIHDINKYIKSGEVINFSKDKKILNIVNNLLGEKSSVRNIEFFLKPKKTGLKAPFHQDNSYWNISNKKALNVWIACTESNRKNGGVCYYENSHKIGSIYHELSHEPGSSQKILGKYLRKINLKKTYPKLNIGDCIIHHCEVLHGSSVNKSNKDRIGLVISYKGQSAKINKIKIKKYKNLLKKNLKYLKQKKFLN